MPPYIIAILAVAAALGALIAFILVRTVMFKPTKKPAATPEPVAVNSEKAISDLAEMIRCRTVSDRVKEREDEAEFAKFEALLPRLFPNVYKVCDLERVSDRALLFRWHGRSSDSPTVLMAHYDVVSVVEEDWERPAFDGISENGVKKLGI